MNSFTKKVAKAVVTGIVLSGVLMSTACSQPVAAPTESPAASQSASATPSATPTDSKAPVVAVTTGPLGVDVNDVMANHIDPSIAATFPNESPDTLKEGVTFALSTYQGLVTGKNFYRPRTDSDITLLAPDADKFDKTYYDAMTARATANGGVIRDDFIAFGKGGEITGGSLGVHVMDPNKSVQFVSAPPVVYAGATPASGNVLVVKADATMFAPTADNKLVTIDVTYWVSVKNAGPGKWLVADMGFHTPNNPVVTDSVAAPEAPNGK